MRRILRTGLLCGALAGLPALAHGHGAEGPNGGRIEDAGPWHAELVARGDAVAIYLSDAAGKPLPAAGFKATAVLIADGKPTRIALEPEGERLAGRSPTPLGARPKGAVRLVAPDGATASAKFD